MHAVHRTVLVFLLLVAPFLGVVAQIGPPGPPPCWPPPCVPVDGGLSALIAAGLLFGGRKAIELRRERKRRG